MRFAGLIISSAVFFSLSSYAQDRILLPLGNIRVAVDRDGHNRSLPAPNADQVLIQERDGEWTLAIRVASPGAAGLQLFIENLRLPQGSKLALYEAGSNGDRGRLAVVYEGVGPLYGDSFWTAPVTGAEALLEVTFVNGTAGDLPLQISSLRHLNTEGLEKLTGDLPSVNPRNAELDGTRGYTNFRGAVVSYEVRNGMALFEGDIVIAPVEAIRSVEPVKKIAGQRESMGITNTYYRWTAGVVPYEIDPTIPNQYRITDALSHWNTQLAGAINIRPRNGEAYYIRFANSTNSGICSSYVGNNHMAGQAITLGSNCSTGNTIHELGHAIGLYHEHTREDRNSFVKINFENIATASLSNFDQQISMSDDLGSYDYGSIMHYPSTGFSINGLPTIETIPAGIAIGQRSTLSAGDIAGVQRMYPAAIQTFVPVTVGTNPTGRQLIIDGVSWTAPASFQWMAGSAHTVEAPSSTGGTTRYLFRTWSDGGAQTHTVTVPSSPSTITANFQKQHALTAASSDVSKGMVSNSPMTSDTFYNEGTSISISALAAGSSCLTGWAGVTAPASSPITVSVNQPYSITGTFQSGIVSAFPTQFTLPTTVGTGSITVSASGGCPWTARSNHSWITITSGASGNSSGTTTFSVSKKNGKPGRTGSITIGSVIVTISQ